MTTLRPRHSQPLPCALKTNDFLPPFFWMDAGGRQSSATGGVFSFPSPEQGPSCLLGPRRSCSGAAQARIAKFKFFQE